MVGFAVGAAVSACGLMTGAFSSSLCASDSLDVGLCSLTRDALLL